MQIVIDIPEWKYKDIREGVKASKRINYSIPPIFEAVANGTPLPKGHGRLIDADVFIQNESCCGYIEDMDIDYFKQHTPTIIPADTESEEE